VRADILDQAERQGVDLSDTCNRALAAAVGIEYDPQGKGEIAPRKPVIIAREAAARPPDIPEALPAPGPAARLHPVINADDPAAATSVKRTKRLPAVKNGAAAVPAPSSDGEKTVPLPAEAPVKPSRPKTGRSVPKKRGGSSDLKKFVTETILREDAENASITKEALYQAFARWCREHRIATAPDRKTLSVALKNQFALAEKVIDGEPSWVNVRLK
jgi:hypothetical protein